MIELLSSNRRIDPSNGFGPLGAVVTLHSSGIKGNKINLLFNSICQGNIARLIAILRAVQLGLICKTEVHQAMSICENSKEEALDVRNIYHKVKKWHSTFIERGQVHLKPNKWHT
jgi:hypothetical protein